MKNKRGVITVDGAAWCGYFSVIRIKGFLLFADSCKHRKTANRQARKLGKLLNCEVRISRKKVEK